MSTFYQQVSEFVNDASSFNQTQVLSRFSKQSHFQDLQPQEVINLLNLLSSPYQVAGLHVFAQVEKIWSRFSPEHITSLINVFSSPYQNQALTVVTGSYSFFQWTTTNIASLINVFSSPYQISALQSLAPLVRREQLTYDLLSVFSTPYEGEASRIIKQYSPNLQEPPVKKSTGSISIGASGSAAGIVLSGGGSVVINGVKITSGNGNGVKITSGNGNGSLIIDGNIFPNLLTSNVNAVNSNVAALDDSCHVENDSRHVEQEQMYRAMLASVQEQSQAKIKELEAKLQQKISPKKTRSRVMWWTTITTRQIVLSVSNTHEIWHLHRVDMLYVVRLAQTG